MQSILACISNEHDGRLLILAGLVCAVGVYGAFAIARHAGRSQGRSRAVWSAASIIAAGCTAWATHMIGLLAFNPGMASGFDPILTFASLLASIAGIGAGVGLALGQRDRRRRFLAGVVLGIGVTALHYFGQTSYVVTGIIVWNSWLVVGSVVASLIFFGLSMLISGESNRVIRRFGPPMLLFSIAALHFCGMAAVTVVFDPMRKLPVGALEPDVVAPVVASVSLALLAAAIVGLRFTIAANLAARRDRERIRDLASLAVEGLAICNGDEVVTANQSLELLVAAASGTLSGRSLNSLLPGVTLSGLPEREERDADLIGAQGQLVPVRILRRQVVIAGRPHAVVAVRDQRERLQTEAKMRALAFSDSLTGLPNRARFAEVLGLHAAAARDLGSHFSVLLIDLDRFKPVNDSFGHGAGDTVLREVACRLAGAVSERDVVARIGGDEFAILQQGENDVLARSNLARRIVELMRMPFIVNGQRVHIGASVGMAVAPIDGTNADTLLSNADLALYKAKADGKASFCSFEPQMEINARTRRGIEMDLRDALAEDGLEVYFQPLIDTRTGQVNCAEALVRWNHPTRGQVPPSQFIPIAEEAGLISRLGRLVLRTACNQAASWPDDVRVAVNLSPVQFRDADLVDVIRGALATANLSPKRLELEITEGVLIQDEERVFKTLEALRGLGVSLSLDDFGTGYSSLSYLRRFPFGKVKIDRSFTRNLPVDAESAAIVRAIVALGTALGMTTTIEGVETQDQYHAAVREGCDQIQGYLFSRPMPASKFKAFLDSDIEAAA